MGYKRKKPPVTNSHFLRAWAGVAERGRSANDVARWANDVPYGNDVTPMA